VQSLVGIIPMGGRVGYCLAAEAQRSRRVMKLRFGKVSGRRAKLDELERNEDRQVQLDIGER
jgi:hypothetical protein